MSAHNGHIWFCATSRSGLGHLRRCTEIASELRRRCPSLGLALATNGTIDRLPSEICDLFDEIRTMPRASMADQLGKMQPRAVIADTIKLRGLANLRCPLALVLRESGDEAIQEFGLPGRMWDLVLLPNPATHWAPESVKTLSNRVCATGWIYRSINETTLRLSEATSLMICTGGGGNQDTRHKLYAELNPVLERVRADLGSAVVVFQVLGPRAPKGLVLNQSDQILDVGGQLNQWMPKADVLISTAGYNSVLEIAQTQVPAMLVAIDRTIDDQQLRANRWGASVGLAHQVGEAQRSADWLVHCLTHRIRREPVSLGPSGARRAAQEISTLVRVK